MFKSITPHHHRAARLKGCSFGSWLGFMVIWILASIVCCFRKCFFERGGGARLLGFVLSLALTNLRGENSGRTGLCDNLLQSFLATSQATNSPSGWGRMHGVNNTKLWRQSGVQILVGEGTCLFATMLPRGLAHFWSPRGFGSFFSYGGWPFVWTISRPWFGIALFERFTVLRHSAIP